MDEEYTKREMDILLNEIKDKLNDIYVQVMKTNGRVNCLEGWRDKLIGAVAVIVVLIVPILINIVGKAIK